MTKLVSYHSVANSMWQIFQTDNGKYTNDQVTLAVLMDIREQLATLNRLLACPNFTGIPETLRQIRRNTIKKRRRPKVGRPKLRVVKRS